MRPSSVFLITILSAASAFAAPNVLPAFLDKHCTECHDADVKKGGLDLDTLSGPFDAPANFDRWVKIFDRVRKGEMPPAKNPRPDPAEHRDFLAYLERPLHDYDAARQAVSGRTILRRLNRIEYERTLHDLLGINLPLATILPEDSSMHGFDTVAEGLRFSPLQMEKYLEAADAAIDAAINLDLAPEHINKRFLFKDEPNTRKQLDTPEGAVTDKFNPDKKHRHLLKELPDAIVFFNEGYPPAEVRQFVPKTTAVYRFKISGYGYQSGGRAIPMRVYRDNFREKTLLGWFEMPADKARVVEITAMLKTNEHLLIQPSDSGLDKDGKGIYNTGAKDFTGSGLALQWVEVEGPLTETWPPPSLKKLFGETPVALMEAKRQKRLGSNRTLAYEVLPADPKTAARTLLENFAARAFRRPLEPGEADRFIQLTLGELDAGLTLVDAMRVGFRAVLTAPQFLLFQEQPGKLDEYALASRLSYFLWSTMPDAELLSLAATRKLSAPAELSGQIERLLKDPRAQALVTNFTGQWLDLRNIDATTPDKRLYPEFDELLRLSMVAETEAFFAEILAKNLNVSNFIHSDFAMLNRRLAEHYGLEAVTGEELRRVPIPKDSARGGLLAHASILKVTANGTTTSPVIRGAWVMKQLLGQPPSPPPPNVGSIEPDTRGAITIREQLDKHRNSETCAGCHRVIDPPGFALESFDVIGGFRQRYRSQDQGETIRVRAASGRSYQYRLGKPVDASGELLDGRKFTDIADFKTLLLDQQDQVLRALAEKLIVYGTGAGISFADRQEIEAICAKVKQKDSGLRTLIQEIAASAIFQSK